MWGGVTLAALVTWAVLVQPRLSDSVAAPGANTISESVRSSSETQTTDQTVRVDTFATRLTATGPTGETLYDQTFPVAFTDPTVQASTLIR